MRAYGSTNTFTAGVVFALPQVYRSKDNNNVVTEDEAAEETKTWSFSSGYSAKTEFNRNSRGELINGRQEALVKISFLKDCNVDYLEKEDHSK